MQPLS